MSDPNEHRLPDDVRPVAYRIHLEPDLEKFTFHGEVSIDLDVKRPTAAIELHSAELELTAAAIGAQKLSIRLDAARERAILTPPQPLASGAITLTMRFTGTLNDKMRGFYRSSYTRPDGSKGILATTQFESTSARRAFPCFDEPALKSTFDVTLVVPKALQAISNMPVVSDESVDGGKRRVRYAPSPVMSSYLVAFAVGEFESLEGKTKDGVPVRVFATPGRAELCRFALETTIRGLEFFGKYYGIPYNKALPKCDLIAIPDFEFGAMENWGAITFRETAIFVDPAKSSVPQRRRVAEVVLHELAHQWFGNLVSPEWWSFLWLNESFATFMAYKAEAALFPEWNVWEEYLAQITSAGKSLDSLRSSHPVEVLVRDPNEVDQIFDAISYNKGGSVLWMLEQSMGEEAFRQGVAHYLEAHQFGNATTDDLWKALGGAAPAMMDGWTRRIGLPVVHAARRDGRLGLKQERFLLDRDPQRPGEDPALWDIPLPWTASDGRKGTARLSSRESAIDAPGAWIKLNAGQSGFYLVNYDAAGWAGLGQAVASKALPPRDRFGLQEDAYSLMRAGFLPISDYLKLSASYANEDDYHAWSGIAEGVGALLDIYSGDPSVPKLEAFARAMVKPAVERVGWEEKADESSDRRLLRAAVLGAAGRFGDAAVVAEVKRRFEALRKDFGSISPNLRSGVFANAARHGDDATFEALLELYEKADLPEVKVQLLRSMGAFRAPAILKRALTYALSDKVRPQDAMYPFGAAPVESKPVVWKLFQEQWPLIEQRYGKSGMLGHFVAAAAAGIPSEAHAADVEAFFKAHPAPYASEKIKQTLEGIRARAKFRARNAQALAAWVLASGF